MYNPKNVNNMKRILLMAIIALCTTATLTAQPAANNGKPAPRPESVQAEKKRPDGKSHLMQQAKHYVELFALDEKKAAEFTEIYHAYNKQLHAIKKQYRRERPEEGEELTEEQVEQRMLDHFAQSRAILDVREEYYKKFRTVLTAKQVHVIYKEEKDRRDKMMWARPDRKPERQMEGRPERRLEDKTAGIPDMRPERPERPQPIR